MARPSKNRPLFAANPFGDDDDFLAPGGDDPFPGDDITLFDEEVAPETPVAPLQPVVPPPVLTPIEVTSVEQVESLIKQDVSEIAQAFNADVKRVRQQAADMQDSEYFLCVIFQTREQKEEFLAKTGLTEAGAGDKYVDGMLLAYTLGVELTSRIPPEQHIRVDKRLADLT